MPIGNSNSFNIEFNIFYNATRYMPQGRYISPLHLNQNTWTVMTVYLC